MTTVKNQIRMSPSPVRGRQTPAEPPVTRAITPQLIAERAYQIFECRTLSGRPGDSTSDWLQAERELKGSAPDPCAVHEAEIKLLARGETLLAGDGD
ncbi:MAG: DUF2934 domain-containing protein [Planctomycetes bacterium]|nr:DUF2934 domain-containing protein [Planctomycetota bacterium]